MSYDNDDENEVPNLEECQKNMDNIVDEYIEYLNENDDAVLDKKIFIKVIIFQKIISKN